MLKILDVKVQINEEEANRIDFEFYEKPTKHPKVILADSALNASSKRTILTQECLRRLRNTKLELGEAVQVKHLNEFMIKLKNSGYNEKYRREIVDSAMKAFKNMLEDDKSGKKPLYRSRTWNNEDRIIAKEKKKQNWWKTNQKTNFKSVLFVPPTPGGVLAKEMRKREDELNRFSTERIKIVEGGGIQGRNILSTKNPFQSEKCSQKWCPLCQKDDQMIDNPENKIKYPVILTILGIGGYVQPVKIGIFVRYMKGKLRDPPESEAGNTSLPSRRKNRIASCISTKLQNILMKK